MGIDYDAHLGYGIKLPKSLVNKINDGTDEDEDFEGEDFEFMWGGNSYVEEMNAFLCLKESVINVNAYDLLKSPIDSKRLVSKPYWDQKLLDWCKIHKTAKPKIGWWLCVSVL